MDWRKATESVLRICTGALGEAVIYTPSGGSPVTIQGIFDAKYQALVPDGSGGTVVTSTRPAVGIKLSDLAAPPGPLDRVRIRGVDYGIEPPQEDGQGGALLFLKRV